MRNHFCEFQKLLEDYLAQNNVKDVPCVSDLYTVSLNTEENRAVYPGKKNLSVIDMDRIAKEGYRRIKAADRKDNPVNTADAFLINGKNQWFFVEFKDSRLDAKRDSLKNNILKKAYANWYMILDILYTMREAGAEWEPFQFENPVRFAKEHVSYIVVCSSDKNPLLYRQIKNCDLIGQRYTPPFMQRLKDYIFRDAYVYTEDYFERKFVNSFSY